MVSPVQQSISWPWHVARSIGPNGDDSAADLLYLADSLAALPPTLRQAALGMGATRWTAIFRVLLPAAASGIVGGVMLALGRAMGETMAVTMLIGNSNDLSLSILAPANTIASLLANQFAEASGLQISALMYAGLILFAMTLVVNILAELIVLRVKQY
jgi:phosphate transport system permease protein